MARRAISFMAGSAPLSMGGSSPGDPSSGVPSSGGASSGVLFTLLSGADSNVKFRRNGGSQVGSVDVRQGDRIEIDVYYK